MSKKDTEILDRLLDSAIENICCSFFDEFQKENAEKSSDMGLKAVVIREEVFNCCDWCKEVAGVYDYDDVPRDVYRRHDNCRCMVLFKRGKEPFADVWSKRTHETIESARKENKAIISQNEIARIESEIEKKRRVAKAQGKTHIDTTELRIKEGQYKEGSIVYKEYVDVDGTRYRIEKKKVILSPDAAEIKTGETIAEVLGRNVEFLPRVVRPQNVRTADYLIDGRTFDRKGPDGNTKNTIYNNIKSSRGQADNVIIDLSLSKMDIKNATEYIEDAYRSRNINHFQELILMKDNKILKIFERI